MKDKNKLDKAGIESARAFLAEHFGLRVDAQLGEYVRTEREWILDKTGQGWRLSEILAAFLAEHGVMSHG